MSGVIPEPSTPKEIDRILRMEEWERSGAWGWVMARLKTREEAARSKLRTATDVELPARRAAWLEAEGAVNEFQAEAAAVAKLRDDLRTGKLARS